MLADEAYSRLVQAIGRASLHADQKQLWHLTKIYWWVSLTSVPEVLPAVLTMPCFTDRCLPRFCQEHYFSARVMACPTANFLHAMQVPGGIWSG